MTDLTPEKRDELRVRSEVAKPFVGHDFVAPPFTTIDAADLTALLDSADLLDEVRDQVKRGALCPMCSTGMTRQTVGLICQLCGTDYDKESTR